MDIYTYKQVGIEQSRRHCY